MPTWWKKKKRHCKSSWGTCVSDTASSAAWTAVRVVWAGTTCRARGSLLVLAGPRQGRSDGQLGPCHLCLCAAGFAARLCVLPVAGWRAGRPHPLRPPPLRTWARLSLKISPKTTYGTTSRRGSETVPGVPVKIKRTSALLLRPVWRPGGVSCCHGSCFRIRVAAELERFPEGLWRRSSSQSGGVPAFQPLRVCASSLFNVGFVHCFGFSLFLFAHFLAYLVCG